jgi:uncharacterized protein YecT (DUF1311 family)
MRKTILFSGILLFASQLSFAQNTAVDDAARKHASQEFFRQIDDFKKIARSAYSDEQTREKAGDCPKSTTTYDIGTCLEKEVEKTTANYRSYADAARSIEGLPAPGDAPASGPTGKPLSSQELVQQFDAVESAWQAYKKAQCSAAYDAYKGGTIAPMMQLTCELTLTRNRLRELDSIYQVTEGH